MVNTNLIPAYADGYEIRYDRPSDTFRCFQNDTRLKNNGKAFAPKSLARAKQFMTELGAKEIAKKVQLWMPPSPAKIAPLDEQLAALSSDAPRFVVVEAGYGTYKEQGYAVYDCEKQKIVSLKHHAWNDVTDVRAHADEDAIAYNENPPVDGPEPDLYLFNAVFGEQIKKSGDAQPEIQPGSESEERYNRQKDYWQARQAEQPEQKPAPVAAEPTIMTFVTERKYTIGETLTESGHIYTVIEESFYLSQRDVDDAEEGFDTFGLQVGWQTKTRKA